MIPRCTQSSPSLIRRGRARTKLSGVAVLGAEVAAVRGAIASSLRFSDRTMAGGMPTKTHSVPYLRQIPTPIIQLMDFVVTVRLCIAVHHEIRHSGPPSLYFSLTAWDSVPGSPCGERPFLKWTTCWRSRRGRGRWGSACWSLGRCRNRSGKTSGSRKACSVCWGSSGAWN